MVLYLRLMSRPKPKCSRVHNSTICIDAFLYSYYDSHDTNDNVHFLINNTQIPFITGDQPVINLAHNNIKIEKNDLYFPISPKYAIIKSEFSIANYIKDCANLSIDEVRELNDKIAEWKLSQLFSSDENSLTPYQEL